MDGTSTTFPIDEVMLPAADDNLPADMKSLVSTICARVVPSQSESDETAAAIVRRALLLFGPVSRGIAAKAPECSNLFGSDRVINSGDRAYGAVDLKTIICNVAGFVIQAEYETGSIDDEDILAAFGVLEQVDRHLCQAKIPGIAEAPGPAANYLVHFHCELFTEANYPVIAARYQAALATMLRLGNLRRQSSLTAFTTPLRHFCRLFPHNALPPSLADLDEADKHELVRRLHQFFDDRQLFPNLVQRTRNDYTHAVVAALGLAGNLPTGGSWGHRGRYHLADPDSDPPEDWDTYTASAFWSQCQATAESMGEPAELEDVRYTAQPIGGDDEVSEPSPMHPEDHGASRRELMRSRYFSADRILIERYRTPFDRKSATLHSLCWLDHWLAHQPPTPTIKRLTLLAHLLLHTGRTLEWLLSIQVGDRPDSSAPSLAAPMYVPELDAIFCLPAVAHKLPQLSGEDKTFRAYVGVTYVRALPMTPFAQKLAAGILSGDPTHQARDPDSAVGGGRFLFCFEDARPMTPEDIDTLMFKPFAIHMADIQPDVPIRLRPGLRRGFWTLYTWHGLTEEESHFVSDQCYPEMRASLFYICRNAQAYWSSYKQAHQVVCRSLMQTHQALFPEQAPCTFDPAALWAADRWLPESDAFYGACYRPQKKVIEKLVCVVMEAAKRAWPQADDRRRLELLAYACAFGLALGLGLRVGEAASLLWLAVDLAQMAVSISGKNDRFAEEDRYLPLTSRLIKPLTLYEALRKRLRLPCGRETPYFVVFNRAGRPVALTRVRLWRQLRRWADEAGLDDAAFRWHAMRHDAASDLLERNIADYQERSWFLGHAAGMSWLDGMGVGEFGTVMQRFRQVLDERLADLRFDLDGLTLSE